MKQSISFLKKVLCNGGLFIIIVFLTYKMVFAKIDFNSLLNIINKLDLRFFVFGVIVVLFMLCAEAYNIKRNLHLLGEEKSYCKCMVYALSGNFFSAITPAATGGQPMQLYYMCKDNIPASKGTLALLMDLCAYQTSIVGMAVIGYILCFKLINRSLGAFLPVLWVGLILNMAVLIITLIAIFSEKFIYKLVSFIAKIVSIFNKENGTKFSEKSIQWVNKYKMSANVLKRNKLAYFINSLITLSRILAMHSAPFWIYKSFGLSDVSFIEILALQSVLYISCAALPLPGGVGVGESAFLLFFKEIFVATSIKSAMVLSRSIGFYSVVVVCGISLLLITLISKINQFKQKEFKYVQ